MRIMRPIQGITTTRWPFLTKALLALLTLLVFTASTRGEAPADPEGGSPTQQAR